MAANDILVGQDALNGVLTIAENEKNKVIITCQMLSNYSYNNDGISSLLSLLGGKFAEIAERRRHPVIENNTENVVLLSRLEDLDFISSKLSATSNNLFEPGNNCVLKSVLNP